MEWTEGLKYLAAAVTGGGLASFLTFRISLKKQNLNEFEVLVNQYKELLAKIQIEVDDLRREQVKLMASREKARDEIQELRSKLQLFESSHVDIPLPMWMKDTNGTIVFINQTYEDMFLKPLGFTASDYIGYKDEKIWGEEIAKQFKKLDNDVLKSKKPIERIEPILDSDGSIYYAEVLKYPRFLGSRVIGISGLVKNVAQTKEELEKCQENGK